MASAAFRAEPARQPPSPTPGRLAADFASGVPDLASAPRQGWAWAVCEACRIAPNTEFGYGDPAGNPRLREVLAAWEPLRHHEPRRSRARRGFPG